MTLLTYLHVICQTFNFSLALNTFPPPTSKAIHYMNSYCRKQPTFQSFPSGCSNLFRKDKVLKRLFWLLGVTWGRARQGSYWPAQVLKCSHICTKCDLPACSSEQCALRIMHLCTFCGCSMCLCSMYLCGKCIWYTLLILNIVLHFAPVFDVMCTYSIALWYWYADP